VARSRRDREARHEELLELERAAWKGGLLVAGLDEAGAGPLAGPVAAACVVLDPDRTDALVGVDDSKKLPEKRREELAEKIRSTARAWGVARATVKEIDQINILQAGRLAMRRALEQVLLTVRPERLLVDARTVPDIDIEQVALVRGDARSLSIAAASILAKVDRDAWMRDAAAAYPAYGFEAHKGYGTKRHLDAIRAHGVTPLHRRTFEPISTMLKQLSLFDR
jgi:ribonuclease HII